MARSRGVRRRLRGAVVLLALLPLLAACGPFGGTHYLPAGTNVDPYRSIRERAQQFYRAGVAQEQQGHWRDALNDYQQARLWDPDNRQDIDDALGRMQARVGGSVTPSPTTPPDSPSVPSSTPAVPPPAQAGVQSTPAIGLNQASMHSFTSQSFPYRISYPQNWMAKPGGTGQQPIDSFVGQPTPHIAVVVSITEEPVGGGATLDELAAAVSSQLKSTGINDIQLAERRQVSGLPAYVVAYHVTDGAATSSVRHAFFVTPGHAWHVILLAVPGTTPDILNTFDAMLDSMQVQAQALPQARLAPRRIMPI